MVALHRLFKSTIYHIMVASIVLLLGALQTHAGDQRVALEVVAVKLKAGGDMEVFRKNDMAISELISKQPGFISRETGSGPEGEWFAIVHWASLKDAESAGTVFMGSGPGKAAMSMIDQNSLFFKHYVVEQ